MRKGFPSTQTSQSNYVSLYGRKLHHTGIGVFTDLTQLVKKNLNLTGFEILLLI